jgi:hypothetical protein
LNTGGYIGKTSVAVTATTTNIVCDVMVLGYAGSPGASFVSVTNLTGVSVSLSLAVSGSNLVKIGSSV